MNKKDCSLAKRDDKLVGAEPINANTAATTVAEKKPALSRAMDAFQLAIFSLTNEAKLLHGIQAKHELNQAHGSKRIALNSEMKTT